MPTSLRAVALTTRCLVTLLLVVVTDAFTVGPRCHHAPITSVSQTRQHAISNNHSENEPHSLSRNEFISTSLLTLGTLLVNPPPSLASEQPEITACKVALGGKPTNCISTASVKQVDCYAPPWTFEVSAEEAMARLKGLIASDPSLELVEESLPNYLRVTSNRGPLDVTDQVEFLVNEQDKVVTFKSFELGEPSVSDFGANRKRLEQLRKRSNGVFGVMGDGLTADSYGDRGTGPLQQLKAFYGLQSGAGYEEVFQDD